MKRCGATQLVQHTTTGFNSQHFTAQPARSPSAGKPSPGKQVETRIHLGGTRLCCEEGAGSLQHIQRRPARVWQLPAHAAVCGCCSRTICHAGEVEACCLPVNNARERVRSASPRHYWCSCMS